jgi:RNA polymerase sigma-70 factor, ECF subfamily
LTFIYCGDGWLPSSEGVALLNSFVTAVALDENGMAAHDFCVAATRKNREQPEAGTRTLGDLLYANEATFPVSEKDWVRLVQAIAAGDQLALHSLYEQTHRIVFTLIVRITNNRETAEELTIDVFYDVWRRASAYDPAGGSVVGWIMNQARSRAIDRLRFENRKKRVNLYLENPLITTAANDPQQAWHVKEQSQFLQDALEVLTPAERQAIESAFFSELTYPEVAAKLNQPLGTVKTRIRSGLGKLRETLEARLKGI